MSFIYDITCKIFVSKCTQINNKAYGTHVRETFICLPDCWLVASMHPEGHVTGHLDMQSWFSSVFKQILRWFRSSKLLLHAMEATKLLNFPNYHLNIHNKIKIPLSLSQTFTTYQPNIFTLTLSLSEGRAGIAWEPSHNKMLFLLPLA
jgi:hypothetical protein